MDRVDVEVRAAGGERNGLFPACRTVVQPEFHPRSLNLEASEDDSIRVEGSAMLGCANENFRVVKLRHSHSRMQFNEFASRDSFRRVEGHELQVLVDVIPLEPLVRPCGRPAQIVGAVLRVPLGAENTRKLGRASCRLELPDRRLRCDTDETRNVEERGNLDVKVGPEPEIQRVLPWSVHAQTADAQRVIGRLVLSRRFPRVRQELPDAGFRELSGEHVKRLRMREGGARQALVSHFHFL
eukprot:85483-Rhodomonas_salina.5